MLFAELLYGQSDLLLVLLLFLVLLLAGEAGFRYGHRRRPSLNEHTRAQAVTIQGAILGLLGLLLGFSFAMAVSRFDARKQLMVEETNALGTAYLRAGLLPEAEQKETLTLFQQYLDVRLEMTRAVPGLPGVEVTAARLAQLQKRLWSQAVAAMEKDRRAVATGLFTQALNEVFDIAAKRDAALENHVPESVLLLLALVAMVSVAVVGYGCGLGGGRPVFPTLALSVLIAVVVLIIMDLDRPRRGLMRISETNLVDLKQNWERGRP
jgi:hypothetical protein